MPIPILDFEDPSAGLPGKPIPVRLACMAADWTPALLAEVVLGAMNEGRPLLTVYEYDPTLNRAGEVRPATYERYCEARVSNRAEQLAELPSNHFVWSNDLVAAYSDLIDLTIGRDSARGLGINWKPALEECGEIVNDSIDLSALSQSLNRNTLRIGAKACVAQYNGQQGQFKDSRGLRYIAELLRRPTQKVNIASLYLIVNPPPPDALGVSFEQVFEGNYDDEDQDMYIATETDNTEAIDFETKEAVEIAIEDLKAEIEDARRLGEIVKREELEETLEKYVKYLKASLNKFGKPRPVGGSTEKKRKAISNAIKRSLKDINNALPSLGTHLTDSITTGMSCFYKPTPPTDWHITIASARSAED